jgi:polyferredoxin
VADIKILSYFVHPPLWYAAFGAVVGLGTFALGNVWCRYMCPLGGLYGAIGVASVCTISRDEELCIDCSKCAKACHAGVRVDRVASVRSPECDGCMDCVIACPRQGALRPKVLGLVAFPWWVWPVAVVAVWLGVYAIAVATGHWHAGITEQSFVQAIQAVGI